MKSKTCIGGASDDCFSCFLSDQKILKEFFAEFFNND